MVSVTDISLSMRFGHDYFFVNIYINTFSYLYSTTSLVSQWLKTEGGIGNILGSIPLDLQFFASCGARLGRGPQGGVGTGHMNSYLSGYTQHTHINTCLASSEDGRRELIFIQIFGYPQNTHINTCLASSEDGRIRRV